MVKGRAMVEGTRAFARAAARIANLGRGSFPGPFRTGQTLDAAQTRRAAI